MQPLPNASTLTDENSVTIVPISDSPQKPIADSMPPDEDGAASDKTATSDRLDKGTVAEWLDTRRLLLVISGSLVGLVVLAFFSVLYFAKPVLFPIMLAVVLKLVFGPVVRRLQRGHIPSFLGAGLVVCGIFAVIVGAVIYLSGPASTWVEEAPQHFREIKYKLRSLKKPMEKFSNAGDEVAALTDVEPREQPISVQVKQPGVTFAVLNTTSEVVVTTFLTLVMLYFLLAGGDRLLEKLVSLAPEWSSKRNMVELSRDIQQSMSSYLLTMTCINIVLGIVIGVGMWIVGLPNPALWGVMAACLNYIPYFGAIAGGCIVFFVGLISLDSLGHAAWAPIVYYAANAIEGYFVTPAIVGRSISLSPLAIIIALTLWGWLWGVSGLLLAVPILVATKIACDHIQPLQPLGRILGQ